VVSGPFQKGDGVLSPDGRWLAYVSDEAGQESVYVRPFPSGEGRWQISTPDGFEPRWSPDGKALFYRADATLYRVPVQLAPVFSAGRPVLLFDRVASGGPRLRTYSPSGDGSRLVTFRSTQDAAGLGTLYYDAGFTARLVSLAEPR
jgi:Tol biopolymer transport system component